MYIIEKVYIILAFFIVKQKNKNKSIKIYKELALVKMNQIYGK